MVDVIVVDVFDLIVVIGNVVNQIVDLVESMWLVIIVDGFTCGY